MRKELSYVSDIESHETKVKFTTDKVEKYSIWMRE